MSLFRRLMTVLGAGGAGYQPEWQKDANIFGIYNLCSSVAVKELMASLSSTYILSVLVADIQSFLHEGAYSLLKIANSVNITTLASTYNLSTAAP